MATNKNIKINLDYSDFTGGIKECNQQMALLTQACKTQQAQLGNNASESDKLSITQQTLNQQINLQTQIVQQAAEKLKALCDSEESTAQQVDKAHLSFLKQEEKLNNLKNELENVNQKLAETSAQEEAAGEASTKAAEGVETFAASFSSTIAVATSLVAALGQVKDAIMDVASQATQWADDLSTVSEQIGISTTTLQEWTYASDMVDVSVETLQSSFNRMKKVMGDVESGSDSAAQKFEDLGVRVVGADGHLRSAESVFYEVIDALGDIDNEAERDAAAMNIFGRSATQLNTLIEAGSDALAAYGDEAQKLGLVISDQDVAALAEMQDSFDRLDAVMEGAERSLSAAFAPAVVKVVDVITQLDPAVLEVVAGIGMLLSVATSLAPVLQSIATITALTTAAKLANTGATIAETTAETGLGAAALATNTAMLPQILMAVALTAALAGLIYIIKELIDLFTQEADAADKAAESTQRFTNASKGAEAGSSSGGTSEHHALGGYTRSNQVWVGEQGAELVDLPVGSYVHDANESRQISNNSNNVTNITVNVDHISELSDLLRIQKQAQQRNRMGVNA